MSAKAKQALNAILQNIEVGRCSKGSLLHTLASFVEKVFEVKSPWIFVPFHR